MASRKVRLGAPSPREGATSREILIEIPVDAAALDGTRAGPGGQEEPLEAIFAHLVNIVLPIAACVFVGYLLARLNVPFDRPMHGKLVHNVGFPSLIMVHLTQGHVAFGEFVTMLGAAFVMVASFFAAAAVILRFARLPFRSFVSPLSLNNVGSIGIPAAALAIGPGGTSYAFAFLVVVLLGIFTYGHWLPKGSVSFREIVTSPVLIAIVIALALLGTGTGLPKPAEDALGILGGLTIPLQLLILGHSLATLGIGALQRGGMLAVAHLAVSLVIGFGLAALFGFTGIERQIFLLMSIMPVSAVTYIFVEIYDPDHAPEVASLILVSTLLTVVSLPLVIAYGF